MVEVPAACQNRDSVLPKPPVKLPLMVLLPTLTRAAPLALFVPRPAMIRLRLKLIGVTAPPSTSVPPVKPRPATPLTMTGEEEEPSEPAPAIVTVPALMMVLPV